MANYHTPVSDTAVQVYNPASAPQSSHVVLFNEGTSPVYLGQAGVTASTGVPLPPNQQYQAPVAPAALYAIAAPTTGAPSGTSSSAVAAGATAIAVSSGGGSYVLGTQLLLDTGGIQEVVTVGSGSISTSIVISAAKFAHASGVAFGTITAAQGSTVRTEARAG